MTTPPCWTESELRASLDVYEDELRAAGKARNTVITYVQHPERFINWLVGRYSPRTSVPAGPEEIGSPRASKYDPLRTYLTSRHEPVVSLTFAQIERILGLPLPASARNYRPWWANEAAGSHVHARSWLEAGRRTTAVDLNAESVDFAAAAPRPS
jgi:hypothetical protein